MISLSLQGVRGGVGVTSLLAAMGHALHALGERVILVDLCPENLLRLHFNLAVSESGGWARAMLDGQPWHEQAWEIEPGLCILPYGKVSTSEQRVVEQKLASSPGLWAERTAQLRDQYDWALLDLPQRLPGHTAASNCDIKIQVVEADASCHILLEQQPSNRLLLVNRHDPASRLQSDLLLLWRERFAARLVPLIIHRDEAMREALAFKAPVGLHAPQSLVANELLTLATWCLTLRGEPA